MERVHIDGVRPLCANTGETYTNACFLICDAFYRDNSLHAVFDGACDDKDKKRIIPIIPQKINDTAMN